MSRQATIRTSHDDPDLVARALRPDNTDEMETVATDEAVVTRIERESTGGLHATVDDYVVNLAVAIDVARSAEHAQNDDPADTGTVSETNDDTTHDTQ